MIRRAAAIGALVIAAGALALSIGLAIDRFPRGILLFACLVAALWAGWIALRSADAMRPVALAVCVAALVAAVVVLVSFGGLLWDLVVLIAFGVAVLLARAAFRVHVELPKVPPPQRPFLFFNPKSGGGKATKFNLPDEARRRGIMPVELGKDGEWDLRKLVGDAVAGGADALSMAGGDGSQAIVAEIAAAHGLPYACIPAGTRNHFALDLGVDREDVVGALDAFVDGGERRVDLAEVNGRVFVNNVSLGLYADAVQQSGYRDAKIRTLVGMAPESLAPGASGSTLHWQAPDGTEGDDAVALLVSNDTYRLGTALGPGTRAHLDDGDLGVTTATIDGHGVARLRTWSCRTFTVQADGPVAAGIDGEATVLTPPIEFRSRPGALIVRIAPGHPGASPASAVPHGLPATVVALVRIAFGGKHASAVKVEQTKEESA